MYVLSRTKILGQNSTTWLIPSMILNFSSYKDGLPSPKTITMLLTTLTWGSSPASPKAGVSIPSAWVFTWCVAKTLSHSVLLAIIRHCRELPACQIWLERVRIPADAAAERKLLPGGRVLDVQGALLALELDRSVKFGFEGGTNQ